jgi:hypothetical protein
MDDTYRKLYCIRLGWSIPLAHVQYLWLLPDLPKHSHRGRCEVSNHRPCTHNYMCICDEVVGYKLPRVTNECSEKSINRHMCHSDRTENIYHMSLHWSTYLDS